MPVYYAFALGASVYCALYLVHCVRTRQKQAAIGAGLLLLTAVFAAIFPST